MNMNVNPPNQEPVSSDSLVGRVISFGIITIVFLLTLLLAYDVFASPSNVFCNVAKIISGPVGAGLASIGIISVSAAAIMGRVSWGMGIVVVVGIGALFSASAIAERVVGSGVGCGSNFSPYGTPNDGGAYDSSWIS